jgi:hypothetical protein
MRRNTKSLTPSLVKDRVKHNVFTEAHCPTHGWIGPKTMVFEKGTIYCHNCGSKVTAIRIPPHKNNGTKAPKGTLQDMHRLYGDGILTDDVFLAAIHQRGDHRWNEIANLMEEAFGPTWESRLIAAGARSVANILHVNPSTEAHLIADAMTTWVLTAEQGVASAV